MKIKAIQDKVRAGRFNITDHAFLEGFKDGVDLDDILQVILNGRMIEIYPDRNRMLIAGKAQGRKILHVVIDYSDEGPEIITVYVPNPKIWTKGGMRK